MPISTELGIAKAVEGEGDGDGTEARKQAAGSTIDAPVVAVELFRHSALVHREGPLGAGRETQYRVAGLPLGLVDSSVRVALDPSTGPGIIDVQVVLDVQSPIEEADLDELQRVRELQRRLERLRARQRGLEEHGAAMAKLVPVLPPAPKRGDQARFASEEPLQAWLALGELVQVESEGRLSLARQLTDEQRRLEDELKKAADELSRLSSEKLSRLQSGKVVELWLAEPASEATRLRLSYQVPGARWFPSYELRVDADGERAELVTTALVGQVSGEDWRDVEISFSTADLRRRCDLPRLGAWRIGRTVPERRQAWRELPEDLPQLFADFDRGRPPRPPSQAGVLRGKDSIERMITDTLAQAGVSAGGAPPPPPLEARADEEETGFSPHEITRETELELRGEAVDLEQVFEDEPTPQEALYAASPEPAEAPRGMVQAAQAAPPAAKSLMAPRRSRPANRKRDERRPSPASASLVPSDELLAFGSLVLSGAEERGRGMLRPQRPEEQVADGRALEALQQAEQTRASRMLELRTLPPPRGVQDVGESAGNFAYRYETDARATLPADGALHRLSVLRQEQEVSLVYRTVPALDPAVYRVARLENPLSVPLLAGPLDVFWGNDFLVTARLQTTAPGAIIEANLGVEPRIKTARNVRHSQHEEGLLSGRTVYEDEVRVEVENGLSGRAAVEVIERLPVTDERKVEVKLLDEGPAAEEYDQRERLRPVRGGRRWRLDLAPGERGECRLRYSVTLPSSSEIVGGGRRA
jgi:hypothetical protein